MADARRTSVTYTKTREERNRKRDRRNEKKKMLHAVTLLAARRRQANAAVGFGWRAVAVMHTTFLTAARRPRIITAVRTFHCAAATHRRSHPAAPCGSPIGGGSRGQGPVAPTSGAYDALVVTPDVSPAAEATALTRETPSAVAGSPTAGGVQRPSAPSWVPLELSPR